MDQRRTVVSLGADLGRFESHPCPGSDGGHCMNLIVTHIFCDVCDKEIRDKVSCQDLTMR